MHKKAIVALLSLPLYSPTVYSRDWAFLRLVETEFVRPSSEVILLPTLEHDWL